MVVSRTYFPPGRTLPRYSVSRSETNTSATSCIETRTLCSWGWTWSAGTSRTCPPPARTSPSSLASSDWLPLKKRLFQQHLHYRYLLQTLFFRTNNLEHFCTKLKICQVSTMSAELEVLFSDAQETLEQIELECHTLDPVIMKWWWQRWWWSWCGGRQWQWW